MVEAVIVGYKIRISLGTEELSRLSAALYGHQLTIACWELCNGQKEIRNIV